MPDILFFMIKTLMQGIIGFLMLSLFVPSGNPTIVARGQLEPSFHFDTSKNRVKPLAVWQCVTGWYGEDFDGQPTANGETYDMYATTAAHPTLPLGSIIRVVNTRNHRSQVVRINDRGPYVEGRELDVSYEVARRLGLDERGLAKVRVELLSLPAKRSKHAF